MEGSKKMALQNMCTKTISEDATFETQSVTAVYQTDPRPVRQPPHEAAALAETAWLR